MWHEQKLGDVEEMDEMWGMQRGRESDEEVVEEELELDRCTQDEQMRYNIHHITSQYMRLSCIVVRA